MRIQISIFQPLTDPIPTSWNVFVQEEGLIPAWRQELLCSITATSPFMVILGMAYDETGKTLGIFCGKRTPWLAVPRHYVPLDEPMAHGSGFFDCFLPLTFSPGIALSTTLNQLEQQAIIDAFERALRLRLPAIGYPALLYRRIGQPMLPLLAKRWQLVLPTSACAYLENRWSSIHEYFHDLPPQRRRSFKQLYEKNRQQREYALLIGVRAIDPLQAVYLAQLTRMKYTATYPYAPEPLLPLKYFELLNYQKNVLYFGYEDTTNKRLLAFDLAFVDHAGYLYTTIVGSSYHQMTQRSQLYFDLYIREIEFMIQSRLKGIYFGPGLFSLKQRFGCSAYPLHAVIRSALW